MWSRRQWGQYCAIALAGAGLLAGRAQSAPGLARPQTSLILAVTGKASFPYLPLTIAERQGFFAAEGLTVDVREFPDSAAALQAVLEGSAHMLSGGYDLVVAQRLRGEYLASILVQGLTPQMVLGVSRRSLAEYRSLSDLRGRRIGITGLGTPSHRMARLALARASVSEQEVRFVSLPNPWAALEAYRSNHVDALCYGDPLITRLEQAGDLRILVDTRTIRGSQDLFGGPLPAGCLASPAAWIAAHADHCQAAVNAMVRALKWLQTAGPSDINKVVPESYFEGDRALYLAAFERAREAWAPDGVMPDTGPRTVARLLAQFSDSPGLARANLLSSYTNQFALKAKAQFRA